MEVSKEVSKAIRGEVSVAKLQRVPVRHGYWGDKIQPPHTVSFEASLKYNYNFLSLVCLNLFLVFFVIEQLIIYIFKPNFHPNDN